MYFGLRTGREVVGVVLLSVVLLARCVLGEGGFLLGCVGAG